MSLMKDVLQEAAEVLFGNAVDTRDREFIRKEYLEMQKQNFYIPFKTKLLYIKSTNRILKSIVDKVKGR